ncbi:iron donor protein CyaY [Ideonella livida]|uniref:Iron-sulfur cluster assembly protein CyaY n=1 Tax=Ideonella livida TaxID=2707176 RepID=A0A7C9PI12_9BURK|nr:iron donor protein CyaY [Ideonella livida]NDY92308.1 iron donor protein CyaY [Ideonella livida]
MTDAEYDRLSQELLRRIEQQVDRWLDDDVVDIDTHRTGGLLELTLPDRSKLIVNTQPPLQEIWLAAKAGGFHFRHAQGRWVDTRSGLEFLACLSEQASRQSGVTLTFV